jgi:hypothetical protein
MRISMTQNYSVAEHDITHSIEKIIVVFMASGFQKITNLIILDPLSDATNRWIPSNFYEDLFEPLDTIS